MTVIRLLLFLAFFSAGGIHLISSVTDPHDAAALQSLKDSWQNTPPTWEESDDPCGASWEGVTCNNSRVTALGLSTMGLKGKLSGDIGGLTELRSLDLSFNRGLTGSLSPRLGDLQKLNILILAGCSFSGDIPDELGNLAELSFLALNSNNFTGKIPPSLGKLSKLYWLDLADNQLTGHLPISTSTTPGLDLLLKAKHFHFNKNQLSGIIPAKLFSSEMVLIHILFDGNQFSGSIPSTLALVQTLEVLRLDRNALTGNVPSNLNNLTNINELNLAHNNLTGPLPNLSQMNSLNYVDLSNNLFDPSEAPIWFSTLQSLTTLVMEYGSLQGPVPQKLFSFPQIQQVKLRSNAFNDTLNIGENISPQLQLVDLQNNQISSVTLSSSYTNTLILLGNPVCTTALSNTNYCQLQQQTTKPYSTSLANCGSKLCPLDQKLSPQSCECDYPYEGTLYFRGPFFRELSNVNMFHSLEMSLWVKLGLTPGSVSLQNPFFNNDDYLQVQLALFPPTGKYFNRSEIQRIGFELSNQTYKPPPEFGPYYFIASPYAFPATHGGTSVSTGVIAGIAIGCAILVLGLMGVGTYAIQQKKRAEKAIGLSKPFASWAPSGKDSGGAPQLKGARWFSYDELKNGSEKTKQKIKRCTATLSLCVFFFFFFQFLVIQSNQTQIAPQQRTPFVFSLSLSLSLFLCVSLIHSSYNSNNNNNNNNNFAYFVLCLVPNQMPMASSPSLLVSAPLSLPLPRARQRPFVFSPSRTKPQPTRPASFPFHSRTFPRVPSPSPHLPLKLLYSRESKAPVTKESWEKSILKSEIPVLVEFYASWCGPCRMVHRVIDEISAEYSGRLKCFVLNTDNDSEIAEDYEIKAVPVVLLFKDGEKRDSVVGTMPKEFYVAAIERVLKS